MNFKYLMILSLMFIISIGAVSATEDVNSTVESVDIDDVAVGSSIMSDQIVASDDSAVESIYADSNSQNNTEYTITNDNYETYFDNTTGDMLDDAPFNDGDVLKFDNVSDKYFVINKNLTILPAGSNTTLYNVGFNFVPGSEGTTFDGITIENNVTRWANNNNIQLMPIVIQHTSYINIINSNLHSSANFAFALANATYCNVRNNTLSTVKENAGMFGGKSTFLVAASSYNNVSDNTILSASANLIYFLSVVEGVTLSSGTSEFNVFENNYLNGTAGMNSAMCWGIRLMGNAKVSIGQNTFIGNLISDANKCFSVQGPVEKLILINNTIVNTKFGVDGGSSLDNAELIMEGNNITSNYYGISTSFSVAKINNNFINATDYGIYVRFGNVTISDNFVVSDTDYAIRTLVNNTSICNNYIISKDYYGNAAISKSDDEIVVIMENNTPIGASIDVDVIANINENATITINVLPFDAYGNVTIIFNGKTENFTINASQSIVYDLGVLGAGDYNVTVIYDGNSKYNTTNITKTFYVDKISDYNITLNNTEFVAGEDSILVINLPEDANGIVKVTIENGVFEANVTNGIAYVNIPALIAGDYEINVAYSDDDTYADSDLQFNLTVNYADANLDVDDIVMFYQDGTKLVAVLTDIKGNAIANATVYFIINGKSYNRTTDENGSASMALNLVPGSYDVYAIFNGTNVFTSAIANATVLINSTINGNNIVKMYQNGTQFYATFIGKDGKALANTTVRFNINGVFYNRTTDANGRAKLTINLMPNNYVLTAINPINGEEKGFNVTVKTLIEASDLNKYYKNASKFEAKIFNKDGSLAINKTVEFNINGVFYNRTTDANGIARLAINLNPGNYTITTIYDGLSVGNNVSVLSTMQTKDLSMKFQDGSKFSVITLNGQGKPLANQNVTFNVNGVFYNKISDNDGVANLNINLNKGEYIITSMWNGYQVGNKITIS